MTFTLRRLSGPWIVYLDSNSRLSWDQFLVWPLVESLRGAFFDAGGHWGTTAYIAEVFFGTRATSKDFAMHSAVAVASTTKLAALIGGLGRARHGSLRISGPRGWLAALLPLPLMVPPFVGAIGIKQLLGQKGALNALLAHLGAAPIHNGPVDWLRTGRFWAVVALTALHLYPIVYFNVSAALANLHPEMEEAAKISGCRGLRKFRRITLPFDYAERLCLPLTIVFIWGLTQLGVPLICDYTRITSVQIFTGLKDISRNPLVYALVTVVLLATVSPSTAGARLALVADQASTGKQRGPRGANANLFQGVDGPFSAPV